MSDLSEESELVRRALAGDRGALRPLVDVLVPVVQARVARAMVRSAVAHKQGRDLRQDMADFMQEVFVALFADRAKALRSWDPTRGCSLRKLCGPVGRSPNGVPAPKQQTQPVDRRADGLQRFGSRGGKRGAHRCAHPFAGAAHAALGPTSRGAYATKPQLFPFAHGRRANHRRRLRSHGQLGGGLDGGAVGAGDAADGAEAGTLECTGTGPYDVP
jgi:hypothetical protein